MLKIDEFIINSIDFNDLDIGDCTIALNIDEGDSQHFNRVNFHENTTNIDDEVGNHHWNGITGEFPIMVEPEDFTGINIPQTNGAWSANTLIRTASDKPFKVIGYTLSSSSGKDMFFRLTTESIAIPTTYFVESLTASLKKDKAAGGGDATDFIFNAGEPIYGSWWCSEDNKTLAVWLEIQEI